MNHDTSSLLLRGHYSMKEINGPNLLNNEIKAVVFQSHFNFLLFILP